MSYGVTERLRYLMVINLRTFIGITRFKDNVQINIRIFNLLRFMSTMVKCLKG